MNPLNIFNISYLPWRRPLNWFRNIKSFFRRFKWAYQRVTRGFSDYDAWDLDIYYLGLFHQSLNYLAENAMGWPGNEQFPTYEDWTKYLKETAQLFYQANECNEYYPTPAADIWWDSVKEKNFDTFADFSTDTNQAMIKEIEENDHKRELDFTKAWSRLGDIFFNLWD